MTSDPDNHILQTDATAEEAESVSTDNRDILGSVQANLGWLSKMERSAGPEMPTPTGSPPKKADKEVRDWSLYLFFRILKQTEIGSQEHATRALRSMLEKMDTPPEGETSDGSSDENSAAIIAMSAMASFTSPPLRQFAQYEKHGSEAKNQAEPQASVVPGTHECESGRNLKEDKEKSEKPAGEFFRWLAAVSLGIRSDPIEEDGPHGSFTQNGGIPDNQILNAEALKKEITGVLHSKLTFAQKIFDIEKRLINYLLAGFKDIQKLSYVFEALGSVFEELEQLSRAAENPPEVDGNLTILNAALLLFSQTVRHKIRKRETIAALLGAFAYGGSNPGKTGIQGGLALTLMYEFLRQVSQATLRGADNGDECTILRSNQFEQKKPPKNNGGDNFDSSPINLVFSSTGLEALKVIHPKTLLSFPAAFRQGMAARADYLGDTGPSSPANWTGELGSRHIHGYINTSFKTGRPHQTIPESCWSRLRKEIREFNEYNGTTGRLLHQLFGALLSVFGMEIMHIELGQDPYNVEKDQIKKIHPRREHFGFRDGISQPFVDMKLRDPYAGGGTPDRNRGWSTVAAGEIFLGHPDEEGVTHLEPANKTLRNNGTFIVFRKLEQDVVGFRDFLKRQRPDKNGQEKLAAQFMGRWKNGVSLIDAPFTMTAENATDDSRINDFLFAADDPMGRKCPLGSHIRRTNPRDTGGANEVRRHRILRRSMAYGGKMLPENSTGDSEERGLLFVAANSRIEQQFEVIQAEWINGSEFLGQAGLGKCPLTGNNNASLFDIFHEADSPVPLTHLPIFVTTRGGDYFFAPSVEAIKCIAEAGIDENGPLACGQKKKYIFKPDGNITTDGSLIGHAKTPVLFDEDRIRNYVKQLADRDEDVIRVKLPQLPRFIFKPQLAYPSDLDPNIKSDVVFVGRHEDVCQILGRGSHSEKNHVFTVPHYRQVARRVLRGGLIPVATDRGDETWGKRQQLHNILSKAWLKANHKGALTKHIGSVADLHLDEALRSARKIGRIDLVHDFATRSVYKVISKCFGIPGPDWLTELAASLPFARKHVGELHPDWLKAISGKQIDDPSQTTLQIWSILFFSDLITNVNSQQDLHDFGGQAGMEFLAHLDRLIRIAREHRRPVQPTFLDAFVAVEDEFVSSGYSKDSYYRDVAAILLELTAATMLNIPAIFGNVMSFALSNRMDLTTLVPYLDQASMLRQLPADEGLDRLIYESDRLNTSFGLFLRYCERGVKLDGSKESLKKGDWALGLVNAANLDEFTFPHRLAFSLDPVIPGPTRYLDDYLLFGAETGKKRSDSDKEQYDPRSRICRGRDYIALMLLRKLVRRAARLHGLRQVPGPHGEVQKLLRVPIGLNARFARQ